MSEKVVRKGLGNSSPVSQKRFVLSKMTCAQKRVNRAFLRRFGEALGVLGTGVGLLLGSELFACGALKNVSFGGIPTIGKCPPTDTAFPFHPSHPNPDYLFFVRGIRRFWKRKVESTGR